MEKESRFTELPIVSRTIIYIYIYVYSFDTCMHTRTLSVSNVYVDIHTYLLRLHSTRRTVIDHFSQSTRAMLLKPEQ